jgi:copper chaperone
MQVFQVDDMTCGHCASGISKAIRAVDAGAKVEVDLTRKCVIVEPTEASPAELREAIVEAGYSPVQIDPDATEQRPARRAGGCGCGCG